MMKMQMLKLIALACALTAFNVVNAATPGMEQCYGIAKAGQNDCSDGTTTCDKSVIDGDPNYFINVPTGLCNKLVGGMLLTNTGAPGSSTSTTMPMNGAGGVSNPSMPSTTNGDSINPMPTNSPSSSTTPGY